MNYSPFEMFRRNLKPLMVFLVGLAMFAFVVLPALDGYLRRNGGGVQNNNPVLASFNGTELTASRVEQFTINHNQTIQFLSGLIERSVKKGGIPNVPNAGYDAQNNAVTGVGISAQAGAEQSIRAMQFASEAEKAGFALDDISISSWLQQLVDEKFTDAEINGLLKKETGMGRFHLNDMLRTHLLADVYQQRALSGVYVNNRPSTTPAELWANFLKANRGAKAEAYGVVVSEYFDQTNASPSEADIEALFEEGKERFPSESIDSPGFRRPTVANFEYVSIDLQKFVEEEAAKIPEEKLRAAYAEREAAGAYRVEEPAEEAADESESEDVAEESDDEPAEAMTPDAAAESTEEAEPQVTEPSSAEEKPAEEPKPESTEEKPGDQPADSDQPADDSKPAEETAAEDPEPSEEDASSMVPESAVRLVAFQDETAADETASDESSAEETSSDEPGDSDDSEGEAIAGEATSIETVASPTEDLSFEGQRQKIAEDLAAGAARAAMDKEITKVFKAMREYTTDVLIHKGNVAAGEATEADAPSRPDLKALAAELGHTYGQTGAVDRLEIGDTDLGQSVGLGQSMNQRGMEYVNLAFGFMTAQGEVTPGMALLAPTRTVNLDQAKTLVSWKIEEKKEFVPELQDAREEVIKAIRMQEAAKLAKAEAERIAKLGDDSADKPFSELIPEGKEANFHDDLDTFTQINPIGLQFGRIFPGNIPQLDNIGDKFFDAAFSTEVGNYTVAPNNTSSVYYVIKPTEFNKSMEELKREFSDNRTRQMASTMRDSLSDGIITGFVERVDEKTGYEATPQSELQ